MAHLKEEIKLEDLNQIIKLFSYCIQDRIDETDGVKNTAVYKRSAIDDNQLEILDKYAGYKIESLKEIKYAKKFCQRILQIFSYFKNKSRNTGQLASFEDRIISEMDAILTRHPIALDSLLSFVISFVKRPFTADKKKPPRPPDIVSVLNVGKQPLVTRVKPISVTEHTSQLIQSTSQTNIIKSDIKKSGLMSFGKKFRLNDAEMSRLYCSLNLDRLYLVRLHNQLSLLQKEAAEKIFKEMLKRNERISSEMNSHARQFGQRAQNMRSQSQINTLTEQTYIGPSTTDTKILREAKKNLNLMETPTKPNTNFIKQKTLSSGQKRPETAYNNWLQRRQSKKTNGDRNDSLMVESSYNFCLKENNNMKNHRRLRKPQQQNEAEVYVKQCRQNRSMHEAFERKSMIGGTGSTVDELVRLMV